MTLSTKMLIVLSSVLALCEMAVQPSGASTLSAKQLFMNQLQTQSIQNAQSLSKDKQVSHSIQDKISNYQSVIANLNQKIASNQRQLAEIRKHLDKLNQQVHENQAELKRDEQDLRNMLRALYERGNVAYIAVLLKATSWDDFLSRFQSMSNVTKAENQLVQKVTALHKTLAAEQKDQQTQYQALHSKTMELDALQKVNKSLQSQQQNRLNQVNQQIQSEVGKQFHLNTQIRLTQSQLAQLEQQVNQTAAVLSSNVPLVCEPALRFQNIPPQSLYNYVHARNSTFSQQDIATICQAARSYDVNPALLVAITGQEQAFVPPGPDAAKIRNNPFNVFYSWQVYNTNLADAANIAANTLRHKLSVPAPAGEDAILWINDPHNPWGIYATDPNWAVGVKSIFNSIMKSVG